MEPRVDKLNDRPVLRDLDDVLLLRRGNARKELVDVGRTELPELSHRLDAVLLRLRDDLGGEVRKLEERGRGRVDGLEEELLEVHDGDVDREPVVCERDRGETGAEGKGDRGGDVLLCKREEGQRKDWAGRGKETDRGGAWHP